MFANVTFRAKLLGVVAAPVVVMAGLGWLVVSPRLAEAGSAAETLREAELVESSLRVVADLANEREASVALLDGRGAEGELTEARVRLDQSLAELGTASVEPQGALLSGAVTDALDASRRMSTIRRSVNDGEIPASDVFDQYTEVSERLARLGSGVSPGSANAELIRRSQSLVLFVQALDRTTELRGDVAMRLGARTFDDAATGRAGALREQADRLLDQFETTALPADRARYRAEMGSADVDAGARVIDQVLGGTAGQSGVGPTDWIAAMNQRVDVMEDVQEQVSAGLRAAASAAADEARLTGWWTLAMALAAAALSVLASGMLSRSMSRRLHDISAQAADIATNQLPAVLAATRVDAGLDVANSLPLVATDGRDEVGRLAESFNQVLAASVSSSLEHARHQHEVLTNLLSSLGRRNQSIIERQLDIIDTLESRYSDPDLLQQLFRLDHLTTGLRRNAENLLILAADATPRTWREPVPMIDVVRSAASETEDLDRVEVFVDTEGVPMVQGRAAVDLSHLLAELVDNATSFSAPGTAVVVTGRPVNEGFEITVTDQGIGLTPDVAEEINRRLSASQGLDDIVADRVGFQVVARLAARLGIVVSLAPRDRRGVVATVLVPAAVLEHEPPNTFEATASPTDLNVSWPASAPASEPHAISPLDLVEFQIEAPVLPTAAVLPTPAAWPPVHRRPDQPAGATVAAPIGGELPAFVPVAMAPEVPVPAGLELEAVAFEPQSHAPVAEGWALAPLMSPSPVDAEPVLAESVVAEPMAEPVLAESVVAEPTVPESVLAEPVVAEPVAELMVPVEPAVADVTAVHTSPPAEQAVLGGGLARRQPGRALDETFGTTDSVAFPRLPVPGADPSSRTSEDEMAAARRHALSRHTTGVARGRSLFVREGVEAQPEVEAAWYPLSDTTEEVHS